jgi:hypothetical protein
MIRSLSYYVGNRFAVLGNVFIKAQISQKESEKKYDCIIEKNIAIRYLEIKKPHIPKQAN